MKTKLDMAHEWYLKHAGGAKTHMNLEVELAWEYADAMQAEEDKRKPSGAPEAILKASNSRELEWQPDWSQAPAWASYCILRKDYLETYSEFKPTIIPDQSVWFIEKGRSQYGNRIKDCNIHYMDSLRKRP